MKIVDVAVHRADLPLRVPLHHASAETAVLEEVILEVTTASGIIGTSEVRGNGGYATGAGTSDVIAALVDDIASALIGVALVDAAEIASKCNPLPLAWAAVDLAARDGASRAARRPLWRDLLDEFNGGGSGSTPIPTHYQIGFCSPSAAATSAIEACQQGFKRVKLRLGRAEPAADRAVLDAVLEAVDPAVAVAIDANGAWSSGQAIDVLKGVSPRLAWIEQPTALHDLDGLREARRALSAPIVADESVRDIEGLKALARARAVDGVHLKLEKFGTVRALFKAAEVARTAGLEVYLGQMDQGRLGSAATAHIGAAMSARAYEVWGFQNVAEDVSSGLEIIDGALPVPAKGGLGVQLDRRRLRPAIGGRV